MTKTAWEELLCQLPPPLVEIVVALAKTDPRLVAELFKLLEI